MLLTISTTYEPATDLGFLLRKNPNRVQSFDLSFDRAHVFYPEASRERTTVSMLLDVDPVGIVRGSNREQHFMLGHYVNDRPYVASSFLSVAISRVFGTALSGRCKDREELVKTAIPLTATIDVLPVRGGEGILQRLFEPLGYVVESTRHPLDEKYAEWGESPYFSVTIAGNKCLSDLLTHLYVLIPVFDNQKHYFVGDDEVTKLLEKGAGWLAAHPEKALITRRYLRHQSSLYREALARLVEELGIEDADDESSQAGPEGPLEDAVSLNDQRHAAVLAALRSCGARSVIDLGCGEGKLLAGLLAERQFDRIVGLDVSVRPLEIAQRRLRLDKLPAQQARRLELMHGSLIYSDQRMAGFDAAALVEVIEHLDPPRLASMERVVFELARPKNVVVTTPNREYNVIWQSLPAGSFRHADHRFEWSRQEFRDWAGGIASRFAYAVRFLPVGPEDPEHGPPTQMAIFQLEKGGVE